MEENSNVFGQSYNFAKYRQLNEVLKNQEKKSISDILLDFTEISSSFSNIENELNKHKYVYSSARFDLCPLDEQRNFVNDQLQLIETLVTDKIYFNEGIVCNWYDIYALMHDKNYAAVDKLNRKVVFSTASTKRPIGMESFNMWNGLQIIDIDIKNAELANQLKTVLFNELKTFHWFLGVCLSSSKRSLHVWTKITPLTNELNARRIEFRCNFRHKYSYIYITLLKYIDTFGYTKEDIISYLDNAMAKPQQGIFIAADNQAYMNTNFVDLRLDAAFESAINNGIESINWITHPDLKLVFNKLEWFENDTLNENNVKHESVENIDDRDLKKSKGPRHYKHNQRWQLANTLTALYGKEKALEILCEICEGTSRKELVGDVTTASRHNKPVSKWAINILNENHGFNLKIKEDIDETKKKLEKIDEEIKNAKVDYDPIFILNEHTNKINLFLTKDQYLSDIKDQILSNLSKITLLEAGAGYGKTEMIKAFKSKVLLILPFTSIIKSKIELDENTSDWLYYYGSKKPSLDELAGPNSMSMTIDKFSHLNLYEIDAAGFEYIVIDESHLLFTSSYRNVMSPTIQRLANCKAKVILMTGTPTAETLFFPNINHIRVKREETRIKEFSTYLCPTECEAEWEMAKSMAADIINGIKIIWPTNKGSTYFQQIMKLVEEELGVDNVKKNTGWKGPLKFFYYKKSNYGDESMDNINKNKSIGDNDIIGCTTYLSVGIDICDTKKFHVYFNEPAISQDIEQYANRLRRNDLYIKLFLPRSIRGTLMDWDYTRKLDLSLDEKSLVVVRDYIRTVNDMVERNVDEAKYNPMIMSLISVNNYIKYDEIDCKYYIDETAYKLRIFEDRYTEYAKQLNVIKKGMQYYGYTINTITTEDIQPEESKLKYEDLKSTAKHMRWNENTAQVKEYLSHITEDNIDLYREIVRGNYGIFKDPDEKYQEIRGENNLYCASIEVLEKNTPIILSLYRFYSIDTIKDIYNYCIDSKTNRINYTKIDRIRRFVNIEYNKKNNKLDFPIVKFVKEAQKFANEHPTVTQNDINVWLANYTVAYVNSIPDLVVDDSDYLESMFSIVQDLWKVVVNQGRPGKEGQILISPVDLKWDRKDLIRDTYGTETTHEFFIQNLEDEMKKDISEEVDVPLPEFDKKGKVTLESIKGDIKNIVHEGFDYSVYSEQDNSNARFINRQNSSRKDDLMKNLKEETDKVEKEKIEQKDKDDYSLFSDKDLNSEDLPI